MIHHLTLIMSVLMLSTAPVLVKFITLEPLVTLVWRLLFVSLMLLPFAYSYFHRLTSKEVRSVSLVSLILAFHFWMWFSGIALLNVSVTAVIFASNPIFTALLGFLILREPFKKRYLVAIALSILGIYLTFASQTPQEMNVLGAVYILGGSFLYSLYMVLSKRCRKSLPNGIFTFLLNALAGLIGLAACLVMIATGMLELRQLTHLSFFNLKMVVLLALLPSILGHTLLIGSLERYNLNLISCLKLLSPLSASLMASYFFGDQLRPGLITGFALVCTGVLFAIPWQRVQQRSSSSVSSRGV